jgi:NAD-dependent SIR2 family protein deacetylase
LFPLNSRSAVGGSGHVAGSAHGDTGHELVHIRKWACGVRSVVVLSGAGISTDSGIGDFRGVAGAWTLDPAAQHRNTYQSFLADPELRAAYWRSRLRHPWHAEPNAGHLAVAELANSSVDTTVITQNTDGLHQRAGAPPDRVIELHGTVHVVECVTCQHRSPISEVIARVAAGEAVPPCRQCGGILKTASTMFGQAMPPQVYACAERAVLDCDLLLAVGTTLYVEPAGSLCASAVRAGAALVIANWDPTPYDGIATELIRGPLRESLPRIVAQLLAGAAVADATPGTARAGARTAPDTLVRDEVESLRRAAAGHGLALSAQTVACAAVTAVLCGAADEDAALAALGHLAELRDIEVRRRAARWLQEMYPPARPGDSPFWGEALPDPSAEELVASVVTPRLLLSMLTDTTWEQDRRALIVLARAAATRPRVRTCLVELLTVLPGLSPAAVDAALTGGHSASLAEGLTSLARNAALPAELLESVPAGTTVLGEFPVLVAESLVEAYQARLAAHPESATRGLASALIELAGRLTDIGRAQRAVAAARRAVTLAATLADKRDLPERAAASLRRAQERARTTDAEAQLS